MYAGFKKKERYLNLSFTCHIENRKKLLLIAMILFKHGSPVFFNLILWNCPMIVMGLNIGSIDRAMRFYAVHQFAQTHEGKHSFFFHTKFTHPFVEDIIERYISFQHGGSIGS